MKIETLESNAVKALSSLSTPNISDAMAKFYSKHLRHQTMDSQIKPISDEFRLCGPAYTVRCYPGATFAMEKAIEDAPVGSVIVCDGQMSDAGVMMGGLMCTLAQRRNVAGAVIDGAVRDIDDIRTMGFPVFSRYVTPRCGTFDQLGDTGEIITCGSVVVRPGDIISGDLNGVVVVPREIANNIARCASLLAEFEDEVHEKLLQGYSLEEAARTSKKPLASDGLEMDLEGSV